MSARFTFFAGKGGVGKTTCAAAAAVRASEDGARVLVVSTDPAHSLGDALAVKLGREPSRVERKGKGRGARGGASSRPLERERGSLFAAQLDADRALSRWLSERESAFRTIAERGTYLDDEDVERILGLSLPGVDELVGLLELTRLAGTRDFDEVIVDTAPTGHTIRLLEMPQTLRRFGEVLDDMHAKHRFLAESIAGRYRGDFADDVIAGIERDAADLKELLLAPRTALTWITLPEELAIDESLDGVAAIEALGVRVPVVVVNRIWPAPARACVRCSPRAHEESKWIARAEAALGKGRTMLGVPAAIEEPRGSPSLSRIARSIRPLASFHRAKERPAVRSGHGRAKAPRLSLPSTARLVLVGGKGGVGKTTVASALAVELAAKKRVFLLSTDPAHSLADALATPLGDRVTKIGASLFAREMDAKKAFAAEKKRYADAIDDLFSSIFRGNMDAAFDRAVLQDLLDLAPPGLDELFAILSLVDALFPTSSIRRRRATPGEAESSTKGKSMWDVVVVDTAPTGHTLRLLALPETALDWVHALMEVLLKYRHVVGLGALATDLMALAKQLHALIALLADRKRCAFVAVARAAELPRLETERLVKRLGALGVPIATVVANAVTKKEESERSERTYRKDAECTRCDAVARAEAPELRRLEAVATRANAELVVTPAIYPPPRGPRALAAWRSTWRAPDPL